MKVYPHDQQVTVGKVEEYKFKFHRYLLILLEECLHFQDLHFLPLPHFN